METLSSVVELPSLAFIPIDDYLSSHRHLPPSTERTKLENQYQEAIQARAQLRRIIDDLTAKEASTASYVEELSRVLVPYRKLPSDLWTMIFDHIPESRWEISWVCRGWRDTALSNSSLWTTLPKIGFPTSSPTNFFESLRIHCTRAKSRPLTISKLRLPPAFGFQHRDFLRFLIFFRELIPRIERINVVVDPLWESKDLGLLTIVPHTNAFSSLKSVDFNFSPSTDLDDTGVQPPAQGMVIFDSSPSLSEMSLSLPRREHWQSVSTWLRLPWTHFKFLQLGWVLPSDVYQILRNAPSLEKLLACVHTSPRADIPQSSRPTEPIEHCHLQSLALLSDQISEINLALFDLPNAREVYIDSHTTQSDGLQDSAPLAAHSISPTLSFQHLMHFFFGPSWKCDGPYLVELLKSIPSLVQFSVSWLDNIAPLFKALSGTPSLESDSPNGEEFFLRSLVSLHICNVPKDVLDSSTIESWQTEIGKLATRRAAGTAAKKSGVSPITITLSAPRKRFDPASPIKTYGKYDFISLNQALALLEDSRSPEDGSNTVESISHPLRRLREFLVEYANHPTSSNADDLVSPSTTLVVRWVCYLPRPLSLDLLYLATRMGVSTERCTPRNYFGS